ncbi:MAG: 5-formyltetrahydrofolate cyclo-ligase [Nitrospirae bacterium]|nr:5-formyltetrahydrofolate cyclo-ligase [Nitrospirota bacterium]
MKKKIRARLLRKRDSIPPQLKVQKEAAIEKRLFALEEFRQAKRLLAYVSFRSEVDTTRFLQDVINSGKKLVLPVVDSRHKALRLYEIKETSELEYGYMGILEPGVREDREVALSDIDLVIIPGAGFDLKGNRLGYGGGYYDKLLSGIENTGIRDQGLGISKEKLTPNPQPPTPFLVALAFEEQIIEEIPSEPHDIKMDMIITDTRLIRCAKN